MSLSRLWKEWDGVVIHWVRRVPTRADLMEVGRQLFAAVYGQPTGISMTQARYNMCTHKQEEPLHIMAYHVSTINRHEYLPLLTCTLYKQGHSTIPILKYDWEMKEVLICSCKDSVILGWMDGWMSSAVGVEQMARRPTIANT